MIAFSAAVTEPDPKTGRKVEGKRFPVLTPAEDDTVSTEQKEYMVALGDRLKIGPTNPWTRTPGMTKVDSSASSARDLF